MSKRSISPLVTVHCTECNLHRPAPPEGGFICHRCVVKAQERRVQHGAPVLPPPTLAIVSRVKATADKEPPLTTTPAGESEKAEADAIAARQAKCDAGMALFLNVPIGPSPSVAVVFSGGGPRAMISTAAVLDGLSACGILDCVTYTIGLSGSTWCLAPWACSPVGCNPFHEAADDPWSYATRYDGARHKLTGLVRMCKSGEPFSKKKLMLDWRDDVMTGWDKYLTAKYLEGRNAGRLSDAQDLQRTGDRPLVLCTAIVDDTPASYDWLTMTAFTWSRSGRVWDARAQARNDSVGRIMAVCGSAFAFDQEATGLPSLQGWFQTTTPIMECIGCKNVRTEDCAGVMRDAGIACNIPFAAVPRGVDLVLAFDASEDIKSALPGEEVSKAIKQGHMRGKQGVGDSYDGVKVFQPTTPGDPWVLYVPTLRHIGTESSFVMSEAVTRASHEGLLEMFLPDSDFVGKVRQLLGTLWKANQVPVPPVIRAAVDDGVAALRDELKAVYTSLFHHMGITGGPSRDEFRLLYTPLMLERDDGLRSDPFDMGGLEGLGGRLRLVGPAGSGKSTAVKSLGLEQGHADWVTPTAVIVVSLSLAEASFRGEPPSKIWNVGAIRDLFVGATEGELRRKVPEGEVDITRFKEAVARHGLAALWVLDGLDEVQHNALFVDNVVATFVTNCKRVIVASRPDLNEKASAACGRGTQTVRLLPWTRERQIEYVDKFFDSCREALPIDRRSEAKKVIFGANMGMFEGLPIICEFVCALFAVKDEQHFNATPPGVFESVLNHLRMRAESKQVRLTKDEFQLRWNEVMGLLRTSKTKDVIFPLSQRDLLECGLLRTTGEHGGKITCRAIHDTVGEYIRGEHLGRQPWATIKPALEALESNKMVILFLTYFADVATLKQLAEWLSDGLSVRSNLHWKDLKSADILSFHQRVNLRRKIMGVEAAVECVSHCPMAHVTLMTGTLLSRNTSWMWGPPKHYQLLLEPACRYGNEQMVQDLITRGGCPGPEWLTVASVAAWSTQTEHNAVRKYLASKGCMAPSLDVVCAVGDVDSFDAHIANFGRASVDVKACKTACLTHGQGDFFLHLEKIFGTTTDDEFGHAYFSLAVRRGLRSVLNRKLIVKLTAESVTDASMKDIAAKCPQLRSLDVSGTKVTDASIKEVAAKCPQLQSLEASSTEVTDASIKEVVGRRLMVMIHV